VFSFQVLDLVDKVDGLVQDIALSFRVQEVPGLLLEPLEISTVKRALDILKCGIEMLPGDFNRILRGFVVFSGNRVLGQFVDDERLYLANQRLKIGPDKEPGLCGQFIDPYIGVENTFQILEIRRKDRFSCRLVGRGNVQVFFKPARAQEGRVKKIRAVGRTDDKNLL
jgi:hypothetical protein